MEMTVRLGSDGEKAVKVAAHSVRTMLQAIPRNSTRLFLRRLTSAFIFI
jgi:hypothetical protein